MKMKILAGVAVLAVLLGLLSARAQQLKVVLSGGTNNVAAAATNTINYPVAVWQSEYVGIEFGGLLGGTNAHTNTSADTLVLDVSNTGTNWSTNFARLTLQLIGTNTAALAATNVSLNVGGYQFLRATRWEHPGTSAGTNLLLVIYPKILGR